MENNKQEEAYIDMLRQQYNSMEIPVSLEDKVVDGLKSRQLIKNVTPWYRETWIRAAAAVLIAAGIFSLGWLSGDMKISGAAKSGIATQSYLMLLYNSETFVPDQSHAAEYGKWLHALNNNEMSGTGEELKESGWTFTNNNNSIASLNQPVKGAYGAISGFFIISASSEKEAMQIASSCPHVVHNGIVELRPINN